MRRSLWRRAGVVLAAYLVVVQAVLAGLAAPHDGHAPLSGDHAVLCATASGGDLDRFGQGSEPSRDIGCCTLGCVALAAFVAPNAPAVRLRLNAAAEEDPEAAATAAPHGPVRDRRLKDPRAPPRIG